MCKTWLYLLSTSAKSVSNPVGVLLILYTQYPCFIALDLPYNRLKSNVNLMLTKLIKCEINMEEGELSILLPSPTCVGGFDWPDLDVLTLEESMRGGGERLFACQHEDQ